MQRIQVMGTSGSGKSTVGLRLAEAFGAPHVELDAINWLPGWTERDHEGFRALVAEATAGDRRVVSGNYLSRMHDILWGRADTVIWLDLPLHLTIYRQLTRSWRRWRSNELLWGTNYERFFPQLKVWDPNSLPGFAIRNRPKQRRMLIEAMADPRWAHIRFVRLTSQREIDRFVASLLASASQRPSEPVEDRA